MEERDLLTIEMLVIVYGGEGPAHNRNVSDCVWRRGASSAEIYSCLALFYIYRSKNFHVITQLGV